MKCGIVGGGVFGVAAAWEFARRGHQVELFERSFIPAPLAAGTDISKAIRLEYGPEVERYAPLVERAFERWTDVERRTGERILERCGMLSLASQFQEGHYEWESYQRLRRRGHDLDLLDPREGAKRFPQFCWDTLEAATFNPLGGWLRSGLGVKAMADCAVAAGVTIRTLQEVSDVGDGWLETSGRRHYDLVVVSAGAWVGRLLPQLAPLARVSRQKMSFYRPRQASFEVPVWLHDATRSGWYGFPMNEDGVVKVALHQRSETVDPDASREIDVEFLASSRRFVRDMLPGLDSDSDLEGRCCFYTNSPTGDFVIERLQDRLMVAGLGSGHGFKFGPVLGEVVADVWESGDTSYSLAAGGSDETW